LRLSNKDMSVEHEEYVAEVWEGRREPASGANPTRPGDVLCRGERAVAAYGQPLLLEGKTTEGGSIAVSRKKFEKTMAEAAQRGARPYWHLRFRDPYSGRHLNLVVKLEDDELADQEDLADHS
jgi:hypothetical protein